MVRLPGTVRVGYSLGSVATGTFGTVPGLLLLPYLTDTLGVSVVLAGVIVFLPKACDLVLNPIAGRISDRHDSPRGPRRPFLLGGGIALSGCFALIFAGPPLGSTTANALWVAAAFFACAPAYAFFQVPYLAMPAEITDEYAERTRLMAWRVAVLALAILVSGASAPAIREAIGGQDGYRVMGLAIGALLLTGTIGVYLGTRRAPRAHVTAATGTLREQLRVVASAPDFRVLLATFVLQALATGAMLAGVDYVARYVIGDSGAASLLFACFVVPALLVTPLWQRVGDRWGKKAGYVVAAALLAAGAQVFPLAMLPDTAAIDAARSGQNRAGVFTGIWTAGETLGLALGPGVYAGPRATRTPTLPIRAWCCPPPRMPRSTRRRTISASSRCLSTSIREPCGPIRTRWPLLSTSRRCSSWHPPRRTRTAWSTRCPGSPPLPPPGASGVMWTRASAGGYCRTCGVTASTSPRSASLSAVSPASRSTCTSTPTSRKARRYSYIETRHCAGHSSLPAPDGPVTPC